MTTARSGGGNGSAATQSSMYELPGCPTVERPTREQDFGRVRQAGDARQGPVRVAVTHHAPTNLHDAVFGVGGKKADVAMERHREPDADRMAVDRSNHGLPDLP